MKPKRGQIWADDKYLFEIKDVSDEWISIKMLNSRHTSAWSPDDFSETFQRI